MHPLEQQSDFAPTQSAINSGTHHTLQAGMLNELLRKQLAPQPKQSDSVATDSQSVAEAAPKSLLSCAVAVAFECLHQDTFQRQRLHGLLSELYYLQKDLYDSLDIDHKWRTLQYISRSGLVMSPNNCVTTVLDDIRVRGFIRSVDKAISAYCQAGNGVVRILYPACGPFAPLLLPLIAYYRHHQSVSPTQLQVTLIDIQPGAVASIDALIEQLDIRAYIDKVLCVDVLEYQGDSEPFDLLLLEAMQHGFSREGHMSMALHLAQFIKPDGAFIPKKITIDAKLVDANQEFVHQWQGAVQVSADDMDEAIKAQRIDMGNVLCVDAQSILQLPRVIIDEHTELLRCQTLQIPDIGIAQEKTVIFTTTIEVWDDEWINEYDSGITHPLPDQNICINFTPTELRAGDLLIKSGELMQLYYRLNGLPGFLPMKVEG